MSRTEIRVTGFGGQGVILAAHIIGRACAVEGGRHATMIQSFGPEARGSACSATLVVSDEPVLYPYIHRPDIFVVMSSEGYEKYRDELKDDGTLYLANLRSAKVTDTYWYLTGVPELLAIASQRFEHLAQQTQERLS